MLIVAERYFTQESAICLKTLGETQIKGSLICRNSRQKSFRFDMIRLIVIKQQHFRF
ncbi:Uncharacterized protein AC511_2352 [Pseudomonas coronafaciens pv. oryzae]|nr:Uncharacterized protein AC511_2352 [Pseudomonas coronafaciens pv. oryzae]